MTRTIALLIFDGFEMLDAVGPLEAFATAAALAGPVYRVQLLAANPGPVRASSGLSLLAEGTPETLQDCDTLLVAGGGGVLAACADPALPRALARLAPQVRRIGSVCTGAFLLAEAGLLTGRRAVTHWNWCDRLAERHPGVTVERDPIFLHDGPVWTSAGVTAGIDLALAMIEADHGHALALRTARELVVYLKRPGGQSQFSPLLEAQTTRHPAMQALQLWILDNLHADLGIPALAQQAGMSPRSLIRHFTRATGTPPGRFVETARLDQARRLLHDPNLTPDRIAAACGFASTDSLRRLFQRRLGLTPTDFRERFASPLTESNPHE